MKLGVVGLRGHLFRSLLSLATSASENGRNSPGSCSARSIVSLTIAVVTSWDESQDLRKSTGRSLVPEEPIGGAFPVGVSFVPGWLGMPEFGRPPHDPPPLASLGRGHLPTLFKYLQ